MKRNKHGFTLIELLVVIAIISILAGLLLAGTQKAISSAKDVRCKSQLVMFSRAIDFYKVDWDQELPYYLSNLFPKNYGSDTGYVCPKDWTKGEDGGVPDTVKGTNTPFMPSVQYSETDDTDSNAAYDRYRNTDITRCSYIYEFCVADCSWAPGYTWLEKKEEQIKEGGFGRVPIVRCFWHAKQQKSGVAFAEGAKIFNVGSGDRNFFYSRPRWEDDI